MARSGLQVQLNVIGARIHDLMHLVHIHMMARTYLIGKRWPAWHCSAVSHPAEGNNASTAAMGGLAAVSVSNKPKASCETLQAFVAVLKLASYIRYCSS